MLFIGWFPSGTVGGGRRLEGPLPRQRSTVAEGLISPFVSLEVFTVSPKTETDAAYCGAVCWQFFWRVFKIFISVRVLQHHPLVLRTRQNSLFSGTKKLHFFGTLVGRNCLQSSPWTPVVCADGLGAGDKRWVQVEVVETMERAKLLVEQAAKRRKRKEKEVFFRVRRRQQQ